MRVQLRELQVAAVVVDEHLTQVSQTREACSCRKVHTIFSKLELLHTFLQTCPDEISHFIPYVRQLAVVGLTNHLRNRIANARPGSDVFLTDPQRHS